MSGFRLLVLMSRILMFSVHNTTHMKTFTIAPARLLECFFSIFVFVGSGWAYFTDPLVHGRPKRTSPLNSGTEHFRFIIFHCGGILAEHSFELFVY